jgi:hypothetical protein
MANLLCLTHSLSSLSMFATVYCSLDDSSGKSCKDRSLAVVTERPHLTSCYDTCSEEDGCEYFAFHPRTGSAGKGMCELFASCSSYVTSDPAALVYIMRAGGEEIKADGKIPTLLLGCSLPHALRWC